MKLTEVSNWLKQQGAEVCFLTSSENVFYLSGFYSDPHERLLGLAIFQDAEPFLICPSMEENEARNAGWPYEIIGYSDIEQPWELVHKAIMKRVNSVATMAIEKEHMIVERYETLTNLFNGTQYISAEEKLRQLRMIKSDDELTKLRQAGELADYAIQIGMNEISEGKTELEVLAAIEYALKKKGVSQMSFSTMVLTGANAAAPHGTPGGTKIQRGDLVLFDLGVVVDGYCSDITRTIAFGETSEKQTKIYDTVLKAQLAAIEAIKPGVTCSAVDLTARGIISAAGFGEYFPHRLGHGLGISIHEYPSVTEKNSLVLQEGMVFTVEPGIYVPNVAGVRIEDDVLVTASGYELLTKFPKELQRV
ncbi:aminopeptidase P family protein [Bacillus sp. DNRA2]|uniref:M24 family metallopeptidase n=1 Tax=Bacillus sp. DNRA2 TaxID=2723053 RepID=UPI00145DC5A4|nr:Xaa-Pro peptidase family protein [Bacillus sp. DNRA2]NMD70747.1 aminopeptidase P family protein [Bacillus sp. DNRA2]